MAITRKEPTGTVLAVGLQTILNFNINLIAGGAVLQALQLTNNGGTDRTVKVYFIPAGQAAAPQYLIGNIQVPGNDTITLPGGPWYRGSGSFVQAQQDVGTDVTAFPTAFEEA